MARKPTEAQQELYDVIAGVLQDEDMLETILPILSGMRDSECVDILPRMKSGLIDRMQQLYQDMKQVPPKESVYLSILFLLITDKATDRYWSSSEERKKLKQEMLDDYVLEIMKTGRVPVPKFARVSQNKIISALPAAMRSGWQGTIEGDIAIATTGKGKKKVEFTAHDIPTDLSLLPNALKKANAILSPSDYYLLVGLHIADYRVDNFTTCIPLADYAKMCGRSQDHESLKTVRREVLESMDRLSKISFKYHERIDGKMEPSGDERFFGGTKRVIGGVENGVIRWVWNPDYATKVQRYHPMAIELNAMRSNKKTNVLFFALKIASHFRTNINFPNRRNVLSVGTLLDSTPNLPKVEDVRKSGKSPKSEIIDKFFRDLDALEDFYYDVIDERGNIIQPEDIANYEQFVTCRIRFDEEHYNIPVNNNLIDAKNKRQKSQQKKSRSKSK